ncbi:MAG: ATP-dependent DNA helicase RecG, partial [Planctomycetota bacterium]|nr:ATP-dependent DNA helicase RecG [Planctomycetota bacterium]
RPRLSLQDSVQFLPGVGPGRAAALSKLGIETAGDLLEHLPMRYERRVCRTVENLDEGMTATIVGQITAVRQKGGRRGGSVSASLTDNTGRCSLRWFNASWVADRLQAGDIVRASGKVTEYRDAPQLVNPRFTILGEDAEPVDETAPAQFEAVYPATASIPSRVIAKLVTTNLDRLLEVTEELHTDEFRNARRLIPRRAAMEILHRPRESPLLDDARRRLAYDELLLLQLATTLVRRHNATTARAEPLKTTAVIDERIRLRFPFTLTAAQDRAVRAIVSDLEAPRPMNRLLQGDVGSGKTVVALYAALVAVANKCQAVIMAPTELLAEQHHRSMVEFLAGSRVRHCLLVGGMPARRRREVLSEIEGGSMDLVVGTQALIQHDVRFSRLALVVVDEQHRFGVRQRATIRSKGLAPHYLVMTATPIPRTLTMTVFGDLDVTTIDGLPPGRAGIVTRVATRNDHASVWKAARARLAAGEQVFVVYPLIDESDVLDMKAATTEHQRLSERVFPEYQVGLLHGRMTPVERDAVMGDFCAGRTHVLVSTTVVEVGIDVPNATAMVIEHAERYGLSQLHQLRGRVGRGDRKGYCFLMTDAPDHKIGRRLAVLARTTDGFKIAEEDLRLRGPGEMLGTRQHGLPELRVADLINDGDLLRLAQGDADDMIRADPHLCGKSFTALRNAVRNKYRERLGWFGVG